LELLYEEAEAFRNSPATALIEQSFVVKKFFISLVSQARNLYFKANQQADHWLKAVMNPLALQIKEHKAAMEKRLDTLRRINESRDTLEQKIADLEKQIETQERQVGELSALLETLSTTAD
jgi:chromosome segregation ATPase